MLTPFCGTVDFERWEKSLGDHPPEVDGIPITRYWLIPPDKRPKMFMPHPTMSSDEMRARTQGVWDKFYSLPAIWKRSACTPTLRARLAFVFISKLYRQMYASTGIATDSARRERATLWARRIAKVTRRLFQAQPMPDLQVPRTRPECFDRSAASSELEIREATFAGAAGLVTELAAPLQNLFVGCFHLVLRADSFSAAQTDHLRASDCGLQSFMLQNVLWRVL